MKTTLLTWIATGLGGLALVLSVFGLVGGNASADSIFEAPSPDAAGAITSTTKAIIKAAGFIVSSSGIKFGLSGTTVTQILTGTCSLTPATGFSFTVPATTTAAYDCTTTGSALGDIVFASTATSTLASSGGWTVESASASTTANSTRIHIRNNTGASAVMPASVGSTTKYWVVR